MKLTDENKARIDGEPYAELLRMWRFAPPGNAWFEGETGTYWAERMKELREADPNVHIVASKEIGWTP